ncbi:MAG: VCBS domain-containing protein [Alphaproteobacteria bacterium]
MTLSLINSFNVADDATLQLGGASYVTTAVIGETTYVFVTGKSGGDNGVSVFSLGDDGTLTNVFNVADNATMNLGGAFALTTAVVSGTTYLFVSGVADYGITVFSVAENGALTNVDNVADNAMLQLALTTDVETMVVGGTTYLFSGGVNDNGVSVFAVGADGHLTNVDNVTDDATSKIQGPQGLATATVDGNAYLFVTGFHDDGVGVYSVAADGHLTNVFNVSDSGPMELDGPVDAITVAVAGTTFLVVSGFDDDGLTVFSVAADGHLTNVFNLPDDGTLKLDNPVGLSTTVIGGTTYLLVAGADDDGLSVFAMGADGALTNVANVSDDNTLLLDRVIGVTTVTLNGQTYAITGANNDNGVSVFKLVDDTNHEPTVTATGNDPTFTEGGAAADIFSAPLASTIEQGQTFTSLTLTVTNVTDGANEILSVLGQDLALTDGNSVAGVTVSVAGTTATVTFPGAADAAALQALIDGLSYRNASENPTEADRVVTITQLTDSGGTAGSGDDTATLDIVSTVHVHRTNDAAIITGDTAGAVTEAGAVNNGTPTATGNLDATDVDNLNDAWSAVAPGTGTIGGFGTYAVTADGHWTYTLDNTNADVQALNGAATLTDTFNAVTADGTTQLVTITIHAQNDAAVITGTAAGAVVEAGVANGTPTATGDLLSVDVDNTADAWQAVAAGAATANGFGTYALTANGVWTYTLDNANAMVQALNAASVPLVDTFTALTQDGTAKVVTVTITGANDAAVVTGTAAGAVVEAGVANGTPTATGDLLSVDVDNTADAWQAVAAGAATANGFGTYALSADGHWTYTLDNTKAAVQALNAASVPLVDTFTALTQDGTAKVVTVTITGANDAAVITGTAAGSVTEAGSVNNGTPAATGNLDSADVDNPNDTWSAVAPGTGTIGGFGTYAVTADGHWTYTLDNTKAAVQALKAADTLTDTFTVRTADGTAQIVTVTIHAHNEAPAIDLNGEGAGTGSAVTFTEGGAPTPIVDISPTVSDDGPQLQSATIVLTDAQAGDVLSVGDLSPFGITSAIDTGVAGRVTVMLTGASTLANYRAALKHVTFSNASENPSAVDRHIEVSVSDGQLPSNTAIATVTVMPVNDAPVAQNVAASGNEDNVIHGALIATDVDSASLAYSRVAQAAHGTVTINMNGTFSYTPDADFNGIDSFTFKANDGFADSNVATVNIVVAPVDDAPAMGGNTAAISVPENTTAVTTVHATDVDSAAPTYSIVGGSDAAKFHVDGVTGALSFITAPDFEAPADADHNNSYIVNVRASDGSLFDDQAITVAVTNVNEAPLTVHWTASVDVGSHPAGWAPTGIADFSHDATSDLAWYNPTTGDIDIWTLQDGHWSASSDVGSHPAGYHPAAFADFNHDGTSDVLWFNPATHDVDLWKIADGQWAGSVDIGAHPAGWVPAGAGDFNGDGTSDVLWYNAATGDAEVWKIADGKWAGSVDVGPHPAGYTPALTGDFNGDGTSDIAWYNPTTGDLDIWKMSNGQWAGSSSVGSHPAGWQPLGAADFNGDGTSDIAWYNPSTNNIDIWLIHNGQWAGSVDVGSHPAGSTALGIGDFDHNGVPDIMWRDTTTGHIENWMLAYS